MAVQFWHVDAFTTEPFSGNPASVVLLDAPLDRPDWAQRVADEFNLPMNAFVWPESDAPSSGENRFGVRLFTPAAEISLSGHGVLSTCHVLWESGWARGESSICLKTPAAEVEAWHGGSGISLKMPAYPCRGRPAGAGNIISVLGLADVLEMHLADRGVAGKDVLIELQSAAAVASFVPDFQVIAQVAEAGLILTAPCRGGDHDFVSRFFAPRLGVNEDWVTGIAHCSLFPYWGRRLGKRHLTGRQVSRRPGTVKGLLLDEDTMEMSGQAVTVMRGKIL